MVSPPRVKKILGSLCAFLLLGAVSVQAVMLNEHQVKAGFLYQFTKFIEWPQKAIPDAKFSICVLGTDPFGPVLDELQKEKIKDRNVEVKRVRLNEVDSCQLLFISESERARLSKILKTVEGKSVLTVSEISEFLDRGGMIRFLMQGNKIRFQINNKDAEAAGIKISSKLLNVAVRQSEDRS